MIFKHCTEYEFCAGRQKNNALFINLGFDQKNVPFSLPFAFNVKLIGRMFVNCLLYLLVLAIFYKSLLLE